MKRRAHNEKVERNDEVVRLSREGYSLREIGEKMGVSHHTIGYILRHRGAWSTVSRHDPAIVARMKERKARKQQALLALLDAYERREYDDAIAAAAAAVIRGDGQRPH